MNLLLPRLLLAHQMVQWQVELLMLSLLLLGISSPACFSAETRDTTAQACLWSCGWCTRTCNRLSTAYQEERRGRLTIAGPSLLERGTLCVSLERVSNRIFKIELRNLTSNLVFVSCWKLSKTSLDNRKRGRITE